MREKLKLNLGCGKDIKKNYINLDKMPIEGVNIVCDFEKIKIPLKNNSVCEVIINHVLEHIFDLEFVLGELHRICKKGAKIRIRTPYFSHESAFSHYQHIRKFTWTTFDLFDPKHAEHFHSNLNFRVLKKELRSRFFGNKTIFNLFPRIYQEYLCWIFPIKEIYYELEVIK